MGDISEMRGLVVVGSFVTVVVLLVTLMVAESPTLFVGATTGTGPTAHSGNPALLLASNATDLFYLNKTAMIANWGQEIGGWTVWIVLQWRGWSQDVFEFYSQNYFGPIPTNWEDFVWYQDGVVKSDTYTAPSGRVYQGIRESQLDSDYASLAAGQVLSYELENSYTKFTMQITWNTALYDTPSEAFEANQNLQCSVNIDFNDRNTSINAFNVIAGLFLWQLPGMDPIISAIITTPIKLCLAYLTFIFILRLAGAVFGGGGA